MIDLSDLKFSTQSLDMGDGDGLLRGDLLMCRTNGSIRLIGKAAVVRSDFERPHTFASYLLRFRFTEQDSLPMWVHAFVSSIPGRQFIERNAASSAGQHNISLSLIHRMPVPVPPADEQDWILTEVEERLSNVVASDGVLESTLLRASRLRQSILKQAFEGKLVPQDPADEPASVLLERIKAERSTETKKAPAGDKQRQQPTLEAV
jgi:type I restriction enzyme S subunit